MPSSWPSHISNIPPREQVSPQQTRQTPYPWMTKAAKSTAASLWLPVALDTLVWTSNTSPMILPNTKKSTMFDKLINNDECAQNGSFWCTALNWQIPTVPKTSLPMLLLETSDVPKNFWLRLTGNFQVVAPNWRLPMIRALKQKISKSHWQLLMDC